jgi:hypothetical protein
MQVKPHDQLLGKRLVPFTYRVKMNGYETVEGTLLSSDTYSAMSQAILLFEQVNDILVVDEEMNERISFYCPFVKRSPFNN